MEDFASMDSGVLDAEFVDTPGTELATAEGAAPETTETGETAEASTALATTGDAKLTTAPGKLSESASTALATIKTTNPGLASSLTRAIHVMDAVRIEFPGGLKEARELKARVADLEAFGPIEQTRNELAGFREYDRQFMTGDPRFVETMITAEPAAFQKLAPMMLQKFAELNPEGYRALTAQATIKDMAESRFTMSMDMLGYMLTDLGAAVAGTASSALVNRAVDIFNQMVGFVQKTDADSKKQVAAPASTQNNDLARQNDARSVALTKQEWSADTGKALAASFQAEFNRLAAGRRFSAEQRANIQELFSMRLQKALANTEGYEARVNQYVKAGDKQGNLRYQSSLYTQHVPRILATLIKPATGIAAVPAKPVVPGTPTAAVTPPTGFTRIAAIPKRTEIDWKRTDMSMVEKNRAVLNDGRMVQWE